MSILGRLPAARPPGTLALPALVLAGLMVPSPAAGESRLSYGLGLAAGHETNPLRMTAGAPGGGFLQLSLDGSITRTAGSRTMLFANGQTTWRRNESRLSGADDFGGQIKAGIGLSPRFRSGSLAVALGGRFVASRSTLVDPTSGRDYEVDSVAIPERFDADTSGVFLNLRWKQNDRLGLLLNASLDETRYTEDYSGVTSLDRLDHRSLTVEPGLRFRIVPGLDAQFSVVLSGQRYDDRRALDAQGEEVDGTHREYRDTRYRVVLHLTSPNLWDVKFGLRNGIRDDTHAGYYDYGVLTGFITVGRDVGTGGQVSFSWLRQRRDYDHAAVADDPTETLGSELQNLVLRYELGRSAPGRTWFLEAGAQNTDSRDPVWTHDTKWMMTGIRFRR